METKTNSGFITIAEYASRRGVSVAAVYKRLDGTLKKYYKEIDGQKYLSVDVLAAEGITPGITPVEKGFIPGYNTQETPDAGKPGESQEAPASQEQTPPVVLGVLEALEKQLAEKDKQIERLQEEAAELRQEAKEKDKFIREQSSRLSLLLEQSQELQLNNQILLRLSQGGKIETPEAQEAPVEAQDAAQGEEQPASQEEAPAEETAGTERRRGFFGRLFGGKKK
jgi:hypothetical protein